MTTAANWIAKAPRPTAYVRLFCLPFAGGGASAFRAWPAGLPAEIDLCPIQLPGRESRYRETPYAALAPLATALADVLEPHTATPYALFGHSMGALVAFELARELRRRALPAPVHLFVSGAVAPDDASGRVSARYRLPDAELIAELRRFGGTPERLLDDPDVVRQALPRLRADFAVVDTYRHVEAPPLSTPISGFAGAADAEAPAASMTRWGRHTDRGYRLTVLPGHHFFLQTDAGREALLQAIARTLVGAVTRVA